MFPGKGIGYLVWYSWASLVAQRVKNPPEMQETWVRSLGWEDHLEEGMATNSRIFDWRSPTERWPWQAIVHGVVKCQTWGVTKHSTVCLCVSLPALCQWILNFLYISSDQLLSRVWLFATPWTAARQASPTLGAYSNSCPSSRWCHPTISSSVIPFSSHLQSFPASGSFQIDQFFTSSGQRIGVSALASVLRMNNQDWSPLGWTGWISLLSKGLSRVFHNTTVQKHELFGPQLSL